ncbi:MAG TPA: hypothetical protein VH796_07010 [Nitrososphaeraceae archaeon]|jgi:hypothetical protein
MEPLTTFILDFQTESTNFESDFSIATSLLTNFQKICNFEGKEVFALDPPTTTAGWSFAKLFISGQFVEKIYECDPHGVDESKGKKLEDKFVSYLNSSLKRHNCRALIKISSDMVR